MSESSDDIFTREFEVHLDHQYTTPGGDWPIYKSERQDELGEVDSMGFIYTVLCCLRLYPNA